MGDDLRKTGTIRRERETGSDEVEKLIWIDSDEEVELELVSTIVLQRILDSGEKKEQDRIRELAGGADGVLARSIENDELEILSEEDYVLEPVEELDGSGELSLVTTQALRKMLKLEEDAPEEAEPETEVGGYNPYDSGSVID